MTKKETQKPTVISLISTSIDAICKNRIILVPFLWVAFFQLLCLEIIYFAPRPPLATFFGPVIEKLWGAPYLHYPANLQLIPRLFQYVQIPLFVFISSLFVATAIGIIAQINQGKEASFKDALKFALSRYVYLILVACLSFGFILLFTELYGLVAERALKIRSTSGKFFLIKQVVLNGAPYVNLLLSVCVTTLFAFVLPLLIVGKKKVFAAIGHNFVILSQSFWTTFGVVFLPSLLYVPILLLRSSLVSYRAFPDITLILLIISVIVIIFIDAIINTAITLFYIMKREES